MDYNYILDNLLKYYNRYNIIEQSNPQIKEREVYKMKHANFIILFSLIFTFIFMPVTTHAAKTYDIETQELVETNQLVYDFSKFPPYTSDPFIPKTNRINILFGAWGTPGSYYTCYLEKRNSNGTWTVVDKHTMKGTASISTSALVTAGNIYRMKATTTDKYRNIISMEVFENIYN